MKIKYQMKPLTFFRYEPAISINSKELFDIAVNRVKPEEWEREGLELDSRSDNSHCMIYNFKYFRGNVEARVIKLNPYTPVIVSGTNRRRMTQVASKLTRLLGFKLNKVNEGEFI